MMRKKITKEETVKKLLSVAVLLLMAVSARTAPVGQTGIDLVLFENMVSAPFYDFVEGELLAGGYTHIAKWKDVLSIDGGFLENTETGDLHSIAGATINMNLILSKNGWVTSLPSQLGFGPMVAWDFKSEQVRAGVYIGYEF